MKIFYVVICVMLTLFSGCSKGKESDKSCVAVSSEPLAWLLTQIAGDDIEIVTLIPGGSNPETYSPTAGTMKDLAKSSAFFTLDAPGFEKNLGNTLASNFPNLLISDVSSNIEKIYGTHAETTESEDGFDPHMLNSLKNCSMIAMAMTETLSDMFPEHSEEYANACNQLKAKLSDLDRELSAKNLKGKSIVVRHPILSYFARDYNISQIALEQEGKEPSPMQMSVQIDNIRKASPSIVVTEPTGSNSIERQLSEQLNIPIIEVNLSTKDWIKELKRIADEIDRN